MNHMATPRTETVDPAWRGLYRVGGITPLITLVFYLSQAIFIPWERFPTTAEEWFRLFGQSKLLGLFYLNTLDIASIALLAPMFLALYVALKREDQSSMAIAALFAFIGIPVFIAPRTVLVSTSLSLSNQYAAASTEAERSELLTAGRAFNAIDTPTPQTIGFLLTAVAVLIISVVMLRSTTFGKATAYVGILASVLTIADDISVVLLPAVASPLLAVAGLFWVIWWIMISRGLLQLGGIGRKTGSIEAL
jgi:hypothetical protein